MLLHCSLNGKLLVTDETPESFFPNRNAPVSSEERGQSTRMVNGGSSLLFCPPDQSWSTPGKTSPPVGSSNNSLFAQNLHAVDANRLSYTPSVCRPPSTLINLSCLFRDGIFDSDFHSGWINRPFGIDCPLCEHHQSHHEFLRAPPVKKMLSVILCERFYD